MKKNTIIVGLLLIGILLVACEKRNEIEEPLKAQQSQSKVEEKDLSPIDPKYIVKILEAEYGKTLLINEDEITTEGDYYVVEVFVSILDEELHDGHTEPHYHTHSMGIHKINMYNGEISQN